MAAAHDARRQRPGRADPLNFVVNIEGVYKGPNLREPRTVQGHPAARRCSAKAGSASTSIIRRHRRAGETSTPSSRTSSPTAPRERPTAGSSGRSTTGPSTSAPRTRRPLRRMRACWQPTPTRAVNRGSPATRSGSAYARTFVQRPELEKLWNPDTGALVPKSGTFHITIGGEKDGNRAMIDPAMHAMPPVLGTVLVDEPAGTAGKLYKNYDLAIDTTRLSDGLHKLAFQNIFKREAGEQSGLIVLPFLVANSTAWVNGHHHNYADQHDDNDDPDQRPHDHDNNDDPATDADADACRAPRPSRYAQANVRPAARKASETSQGAARDGDQAQETPGPRARKESRASPPDRSCTQGDHG